MKRKPDWRSALLRTVHSGMGTPFAWGVNDCALRVADCVLAMTGEDLGTPFRGTYTTAAGALMAIKRAGFDDLAALAAHHFPEWDHVSRARMGDVAAVKSPETGWALGIVVGPRVQLLAPSGAATIDYLRADRAFRVG